MDQVKGLGLGCGGGRGGEYVLTIFDEGLGMFMT